MGLRWSSLDASVLASLFRCKLRRRFRGSLISLSVQTKQPDTVPLAGKIH